ncbi:MAG TPA: GatB/YqeY domain-containing protein [bacterium]|nr:GatB/YqeY domain-containing protein [bacterium]
MLFDNINADLKEAMKDRNLFKTTLLRSILAVFKNEAIDKHKVDSGLAEDEILAALKREVKKRKDSVLQYEKGARADLAQKEKDEIVLIQKYLPTEMDEVELKKIVLEVIAEMGEIIPSHFGKVIKNVMAKTNGQANGAMISKLVKEALQ